jgi:MoaA/NifB/PqqE/SkfB family radical SAM enzyme
MSKQEVIASPDKYHLTEGPTCVNIETTWRCNLKCKMCGHSDPDFVLPPQPDISMEAIINLRPILASAKTIWLSGYGEPLMHPRIFDIITAGFTTNATLLSRPSFIDRLIESRLDLVQVSFEGYDADLGHQAASAAMRNLRALRDRKASLGVRHPKIEFTTVLMKDNINQLKSIIDAAIEVGGESLVIQPLRVGSVSTNLAQYAEQDVYTNKAFALPLVQEAVEYGKSRGMEIIHQFMDEGLTVKRRKCTYPFWFFHVAYEGSVFMCCNGQSSGENLSRKNAWDIWNSEAYKRLRHIVDTENYDRRCWECPLFQPSIEDVDTLKRELSLLSMEDLVEYIILQRRYIREAHRQYDTQVSLLTSQRGHTMKLVSALRQSFGGLRRRLMRAICRLPAIGLFRGGQLGRRDD